MTTVSSSGQIEWYANQARQQGILWNYYIPLGLGTGLLVLVGLVVASAVPWRDFFLVMAVGYSFLMAALGKAIAREPHALAITEKGLVLRLGLWRTRRDVVLPWDGVERFTIGISLRVPTLVAHFAGKRRREIGFVSRELAFRIMDSHRRSANSPKAVLSSMTPSR